MSEEEEIVPKSRQANAAIAPRRFQQVVLFLNRMENLTFSNFKLNAGLRSERRTFEEIREQPLEDFYEDPEFPAIPGSLFCTNYNRPANADQIEWLRPRDICQILGLPA